MSFLLLHEIDHLLELNLLYWIILLLILVFLLSVFIINLIPLLSILNSLFLTTHL